MAQKLITAAAALTLGATGALAGGIERTNQAVGVLFEEGKYVEFSFGAVNPKVSGVATGFSPTPGALSGDMAPSYVQFGAAFRDDISETLSYAVIFDQPFGADVAYPLGTGYFGQGSTASLKSNALTGILKYTSVNNISVYGGLRAQSLSATALVPFIPGGYSANGSRDLGTGFTAGAAWEKPEIAARVSLTYNSKVKHSISTIETSGLGTNPSTTIVNTPQSASLDFQTGVAADTLLFGSVRWVDWSEFDITPADYNAITGGSLVSYDNDTYTFSLGLGRRINEKWAMSFRVNYEEQQGGFASNLGPTDGQLGAVLGVQYTQGSTEISGGLSYVDIGDAQTTLGGGVPASNFNGNSAIGAGIRVGYRF